MTVLGDGLAVLADERGEPAERDPLIRRDPECARIDPVRRGEVGLSGEPGIEGGSIVKVLAPPAALVPGRRQFTNRVGEPGPAPPELPDVVMGATALGRPAPQRRQSGGDRSGRSLDGHRIIIGH